MFVLPSTVEERDRLRGVLDFIWKKPPQFYVWSCMRHSFKDKDGTWKQLGESRSIEDALLEKEHDDPAAIASEAAKEGISVESYLHMRTNQEQVHRLRRMVQAGNEMVEAEKLRNPQKAKQMDALLQAHINGLLGLNPDLDPVPPEPRNRGGAPKGNKNASKLQNNPPLTPK